MVFDNTGRQPLSIINHGESGYLEIHWADAHCKIDHALLRRHCNCATCRSGNVATAIGFSAVRLIEIIPVGAYGVQLVFDDEHNRGIYPWSYLRELAQTGTSFGSNHKIGVGNRYRP